MKGSKISVKLMLLAMICTLLISVGATPAAYAAGKQQNVVVNKADFHFIVDGKVYHAPKETQGFLYNNRVYVPIRFASYLLEQWVDWNSKASTVSINKPNAAQLKQLQGFKSQYLVTNANTSKAASSWNKETIYTLVDAASYKFFGKAQSIPKDVTTFLHKGTVYVPLRFFAESIQHDITYNSATKSVIMNSRSSNPEGSANNGGTGSGEAGSGDTGSEGTGSAGVGTPATPPARADIVAAAKKELDKLESKYATKAFALMTKYDSASAAEKDAYIAQAFEEVDKADAEVAAVIEQMNKDLEKYNYEIGNDGEKFLETYEKKKEQIYERFLNNFQ